MSRSTALDDQTGFILTILVGGTVYAHRLLIKHLITYATITISSIVISIILVKAYKLFKKLRQRKNTNPNIDTMTGVEFEYYVADLLKINGYTNVRLTEKYDYGIDIISIKDGITWGIQTKRYSGLVKANAVRQVVTALPIYNCDRAMVISNSSYSKVAIELAKHNRCVLIEIDELGTFNY